MAGGSDEELGAAGEIAAPGSGTPAKLPVKSNSPREYAGWRVLKCDVLIFEAHLEAVFAVDLGEVIDDLEGLADLVGGKEVVAAEVAETGDADLRQTTVQVALRDALRMPNCAGMPSVEPEGPLAGGVAGD